VVDPFGDVMFTLPQGRRAAGPHTLTWPADALADGAYSVVLVAAAGTNQTTTAVNVGINRTLAGLAGLPAAVSPDRGGTADALTYASLLTVPADVVVTATRSGSPPVTLAAATLPAGPATATWAGTDAAGTPVPDGAYTLVVRATNGVGTVTQS